MTLTVDELEVRVTAGLSSVSTLAHEAESVV